jgi:hypothetical protein
MKFCLLAIAGAPRPAGKTSRFVFFAHSVAELEEPERLIELTDRDFLRMNPNTKTAPIFRSRRDAEITRRVYERVPVLIREGPPEEHPWGVKLSRMFDMTNDAHLFRTRSQLEQEGFRLTGNIFSKKTGTFLPLYEGRLGHQFNHRYASEPNGTMKEFSEEELRNPEKLGEPQYWVEQKDAVAYFNGRQYACKKAVLGFRRIARNTDERTCIATILPWGALSYGWILSLGPAANDLLLLCGIYNSFAFDYLLRNSLSQPSIPQGTIKQIPAIVPSVLSKAPPWAKVNVRWYLDRLLELVYTATDLSGFAVECGYTGQPFTWDPERRFSLHCELDAAFFHLYGIDADDADYILETFPIMKRHDEAEFGEYRTKRVILERFGEYGEGIKRNNPDEFALVGGDSSIPKGPYPPVPAFMSIPALLEYLARLGVQVDNNRAAGGGMWVYRNKAEFGSLADHLQKSGVDVRYYPEGRKLRLGEQYEIDPGKRLRW